MATTKEKGRKYSLAFATVVAFCTVCTAGVSTFAWFQATANVSISATNSSTSITVSKPDDYTFYYYSKNGTADYGDTDDFEDDFSSVTSDALTTNVTLYNGLYPGQSAVFAMKVENLAASSDDVTLSISKIISNDTTKESGKTHKRYVQGGTVQINIGWAIDIYAIASSSSSAYSSLDYESSTKNFLTTTNTNGSAASGLLEDHFKYSYSNERTDLEDGSYSSPYNGSDEISLDITLIDGETATASTMYYFFRVYFSNDSDTWYRELESDNAAANTKTVPGNDDTDDRYFYKDSSNGTSNCYSNLTFALKEMSLDW